MRIRRPKIVALCHEGIVKRSGHIARDNAIAQDLLIITVLWCLAALFVNPLGNFPLNDDWSYAAAVRRLFEEGTFHPTGWTAMTLVSQVVWGALFCIPQGFSFTALRFSTLTIALLGIYCFYLLLRQLSVGRSISLLASMTYAFAPLSFALSYTFMTDVPFISFTLFSAFFFLRNIILDSGWGWLLGILFAVGATLCRQLGIFLPIAFALTLIITKGLTTKTLVRAFLPVLVVSIILFCFNYWLALAGYLPKDYNRNIGGIIGALFMSGSGNVLRIIAANTYTILMYLGLLTLPLLPLMQRRVITHKGLRFVPYAISFAFLILFALSPYYSKSTMPLAGNIIIKGGIGPILLADTQTLLLSHEPVLPRWIWILATILSLFGAVILLFHMTSTVIAVAIDIRRIRENNQRIAALFFLVSAAIYAAPIIMIGDFYDRYIIPLLPFIIAIIVPSLHIPDLSLRRLHLLVAACLLVPLSAYSVAGTHDYLMWNRARWEALRYLTESERVPVSAIDGGFEFNGWYLYDDHFQKTATKSWWWVHDNMYLITLGEADGYDIVRQYRFQRWMPAGEGQIFVLQRRA